MINEYAPGSFWIDLDLRHPEYDPNRITEELGVQPWRSLKSTKVTHALKQKSSIWKCLYRKGSGNEDFDKALDDVLYLCKDRQVFMQNFMEGGGNILVSINQSVPWDEGVLFRLRLQPEFLRAISTHNISLQVQAWSAEPEAK